MEIGKKHLSLIGIVLSAILILSIFTACGKENSKETAKKTSGSKTSTSASRTTVKTGKVTVKSGSKVTEEPSVKEGETEDSIPDETESSGTGWAEDIIIDAGEMSIDYEGKTIIIGTWNAGSVPTDSQEQSPSSVVLARRQKALEEKYNCKIEWHVESHAVYLQSLINAALSGIKYVDAAHTAASFNLCTYIKQNIFLPLDDYIDYEAPIIKDANKYMYYGTLWKGKHYGIGASFRNYCEFFNYNKEITDREGQPDVLDLVEANQWNWDTFLDIASACTRDLNGDGFRDQYGVTSPYNLYFAKYFLYSNGVTQGITVTDDDIRLNISDPAALRTFQFIADCALVHKVFVTGKVDTGIYPQGKAAFMINNWGGPNGDCLRKGMKSFMAPMPKGPDAENYANMNTSQFFAITSSCDNPDIVAKIINEMYTIYTIDGQYIPEIVEMEAKYYPSDWQWNSANPARVISSEREYKLAYEDLYKYYKPDFSDGFPDFKNKLETLVINHIIAGRKTVTQAVEEAKMELDSMIEPYR